MRHALRLAAGSGASISGTASKGRGCAIFYVESTRPDRELVHQAT
jgi:hypothetical protein